MPASIWGNSDAPVLPSSSELRSEAFVAFTGQTAFTLTAFTYVPGSGTLLVFVNGVLQLSAIDFIETSTSVITFVDPLEAGDIVTAWGLAIEAVAAPIPPDPNFNSVGVDTDIVVTGNATVGGDTVLGQSIADSVRMNGHASIGAPPNSQYSLLIGSTNLTSAVQVANKIAPVFNSQAVGFVVGTLYEMSCETVSWSMSSATAIRIDSIIAGGASATITNQYGIHINDLGNAATNMAIRSLVSAGTNKWNMYAAGTASNHFNGSVLIGTTTAGASKLVVNDSSIQINTAKTPASATDTGTQGQIAWDANFIYVCVATNTWRRAPHSTW